MATEEILVLPFFGQGHLFPTIELCKSLSSLHFSPTLLLPSHLSSSVHRDCPLFCIAEIPSTLPPPPPESSLATPPPPPPPISPGTGPFHGMHHQMGQAIESFLLSRPESRPVCVVIDVMMSWAKDIFHKFGLPTIAFFTSGACSAATEFGSWIAHVEDLLPGEIRVLPGLPESMAVSYSDVKLQGSRRPPGPPPGHGPPPGAPPPPGGPPGPGKKPMWLSEVEGTIAIMINTCHDLEGPFLDYMADKIGKPVWGVGPLLPEEYWKSSGSVIHDREIRPEKKSNYSDEEVAQWLDSKPHGSVLYVSFGSEVGPTLDEYAELAIALEESDRAFIWVIRPGPIGQPGSGPLDVGCLDSKVGVRGLIIRGWAPQLLILTHPATGGFLTHCGWNSIVEALGRGVPLLAWPIRGDQYYNAKLVVAHLKVGYMVQGEDSKMVSKGDILKGIEKLMDDQEVKRRAVKLGKKFEGGFPMSSKTTLDAFREFMVKYQ